MPPTRSYKILGHWTYIRGAYEDVVSISYAPPETMRADQEIKKPITNPESYSP